MKFRFVNLLPLALVMAAMAWPLCATADERSTREYEVKAAFIYKFAEFMEWPAGAFTNDTDPIVVATFGDDPFEGSLDRVLAGKSIGSRPLVVRHFASSEQIGRCHMLFAAANETGDVPAVLRKWGKSPVMTIGDGADFCEAGGVIQFILEDGKIHFEINTEAANASGVKISSRLLKLAKIYKP